MGGLSLERQRWSGGVCRMPIHWLPQTFKEIKGEIMKNKVIKLVDNVTRLLTVESDLRDNDRRLICNIWWKSVSNPKLLTFEDFIKLYIKGKVPESDSITRCRRKVQEEKRELRGKTWDLRHGLEDVIKEELKEIGSTI
jgi:hypothetical protein